MYTATMQCHLPLRGRNSTPVKATTSSGREMEPRESQMPRSGEGWQAAVFNKKFAAVFREKTTVLSIRFAIQHSRTYHSILSTPCGIFYLVEALAPLQWRERWRHWSYSESAATKARGSFAATLVQQSAGYHQCCKRQQRAMFANHAVGGTETAKAGSPVGSGKLGDPAPWSKRTDFAVYFAVIRDGDTANNRTPVQHVHSETMPMIVDCSLLGRASRQYRMRRPR